MILAGLTAAQLAAIFGAAGFGVLVLYILKLRRRIAAVPFSPLWERILRDKEATTLFSRLKRLVSLLLQLALLALLVFALGDPRAAESLLAGRTVVVLVDASASMQAVDVTPNRLASAKDEVKKLIAGLGGADRMLIAQMDAMVTPMGPLTSDTSALDRELGAIQATDARADFPRALRFATDVLRGAPRGEVVVVSDGALGEATDASGVVHLGAAKVSYVRVGKGARNVGITQFSVRRYPIDKSRYEVMLELTNTGTESENVELQLLGDGALVDVSQLTLRAGERLPRFYPQLSGASRTLEAKIALADGSHDDLAADDHAYALLPARRRAKVLVVTEGDTYLDAALLLDEYLDVTDVAPKSYAARIAESPWDAVIFDRVTPAEPPPTHALYLDPAGPGAPVKVGAELKQPAFDKIDRKHPALRFLALDDVNIATGTQARARARRQGAGRIGRRRVAHPRGREPPRPQVRRGRFRRARQRPAAPGGVAALHPRLHRLVHRRRHAVPLQPPHRRRLAPSGRRLLREGFAQAAGRVIRVGAGPRGQGGRDRPARGLLRALGRVANVVFRRQPARRVRERHRPAGSSGRRRQRCRGQSKGSTPGCAARNLDLPCSSPRLSSRSSSGRRIIGG